MLVISTREFREKQEKYLHKAKNGEDIISKSRENGSFKLVPVTDNDIVIDKSFILQPDSDLARIIPAEEFMAGIEDDLKEMFKTGKK